MFICKKTIEMLCEWIAEEYACIAQDLQEIHEVVSWD